MATRITIVNFNVENLFVYRRLREKGIDLRFKEKPVSINDLGYKEVGVRDTALAKTFLVEAAQRRITARCMAESPAPHDLPHIVSLQEIEGLDTLRKFRSDFLHKLTVKGSPVRFPYALSIDGNDSLLIDVGVLSRLPIANVRTHMFTMRKTATGETPVFPRDCLEVDFWVDEARQQGLTLFINHFTSKLSDKSGEKREEQSQEVIRVIKQRFGPDLRGGDFIVCGDLNDTPASPALAPLYDPALGLHDVVGKVPQAERWTHFYYDDKGKPRELSQLDHFLVSPSLWAKNNGGNDIQVTIDKRGLLQTIRDWPEARTGPLPKPFKGVTREPGTEGSDHCPVYVSLQV